MDSRPGGYPVVLRLAGVPVLLVGGGNVASRKADGLLAAGAVVTVVAPQVLADLRERVLAAGGAVRERGYEPSDLDGHRLVMTATDVPAVNAQVAADATARQLFVNSADDPENCSFTLPAVTRRGAVIAAVGTDGASPALARHLRDRIASDVLVPGIEQVADDLAAQRADFHAQGISTETVDWTDRLHASLDRFT